MDTQKNIRERLFLSQENYANLLSVSLSLIALVETGKRILRGTPLAKESKLMQKWMQLIPTANIQIPQPQEEIQEAKEWLTNRLVKLQKRKRKLEKKQADSSTRKSQAYEALHFYDHFDFENFSEIEQLVLGLGKRSAKAETSRYTLAQQLEDKKALFVTQQEIEWINTELQKLEARP